MLKLTSFALACCLALAACASAPARRGGASAAGADGRTILIAPEALIFTGFDADRDRIVTTAEFETGARGVFSALADPGAGGVRVIALQDWLSAELGSPFLPVALVNFDPDADGVVSEADFLREMTRRFATRDADGDGALTRGEFLERMQGPLRAPSEDPEFRRPPRRP